MSSTLRFQPFLDSLLEERALISALGKKTAEVSVTESAQPMVIAAIAQQSQRRPIVVVTPTLNIATRICADLNTWLATAESEQKGGHEVPDRAAVFPAWETLPFERVSPGMDTMGQRQHILAQLRKGTSADVLVVPVRALLQRISPTAHALEPIEIDKDSIVDSAGLLKDLTAAGYRRTMRVENRGEFAVRGSIIDIYPANEHSPIRVDLWGDEVERLSRFAVSDQRSTDEIKAVSIVACRELLITEQIQQRASELMSSQSWGRQHWQRFIDGQYFDGMESWLPFFDDQMRRFIDEIGSESHIILVDPSEIKRRARDLLDEEADLVSTLAQTWQSGLSGEELPRLHVELDSVLDDNPNPVWMMKRPMISDEATTINAVNWDKPIGDRRGPIDQLTTLMAQGYSVYVCADTSHSSARIASLLSDYSISLEANSTGPVSAQSNQLIVAPLLSSAIFETAKIAFLSETELTGRRRSHRQVRKRATSASDIEDLKVDSYVVHRQHGIARFSGLEKRAIGGVERDYLVLQYRGTDKLFLPSDQIHAIRHYTGGDTPKLSKMGGSDWQRTKAKAQSAAAEVAQDLVVLYQKRVSTPGHAYGADTPWQREMEAAFPYSETPDQLKAIEAVKEDMQKSVPMDRLVCGDVGFGKTEIAIRAVFKAVQDSKQAAVLVPTTLLAQQHFQTFRDRFASYPIKVEVLSRFLTAAQAKSVVKRLAQGDVDVIIGTHRILSKDIKIPELGLLVIDEEQRFGVKHKEIIKQMKESVDVLTLTATPIPRTLEMSLTGIRDLTLLQTPPSARQPILTYVGEYDTRSVSEAIRRELLREGQVFFVHNRVSSIEQVAEELRELVPEARVAVAHGQMDEGSLEQVVYDFWEGSFDVLVCTTIIESGIDMPSVNTLVVDRADQLGLGQLHQLRGRVGRSGQRGYAYLLHPADRVLSEVAYERLKAIGESTELGSGFRLAMRDLEIRGAGNLVGTGQSGHIAAVGYDLYCQLVTEAVAGLKGEKPEITPEVKIEIPIPANLPRDYVEEEKARLSAYRSLSTVTEHWQVSDIETEWLDRFGPIPEPARALLNLATLRVMCLEAGIEEVIALKGPGFGGPKAFAKIRPVTLAASKEVRLERKYKDSEYQGKAQLLKLAISSRRNCAEDVIKALIELELARNPEEVLAEHKAEVTPNDTPAE